MMLLTSMDFHAHCVTHNSTTATADGATKPPALPKGCHMVSQGVGSLSTLLGSCQRLLLHAFWDPSHTQVESSYIPSLSQASIAVLTPTVKLLVQPIPRQLAITNCTITLLLRIRHVLVRVGGWTIIVIKIIIMVVPAGHVAAAGTVPQQRTPAIDAPSRAFKPLAPIVRFIVTPSRSCLCWDLHGLQAELSVLLLTSGSTCRLGPSVRDAGTPARGGRRADGGTCSNLKVYSVQ